MARYGRGTIGRQDLPGSLGFEQPIPRLVPPSATTNAATGTSGTGATLNGTVNPNGQLTCTYHFEWGLTTSYGTSTTPASAGVGTTGAPVSAAITGLTLGQTYHYRVVAVNADGTTNGNDQSFVAANLPAPVVTTDDAIPLPGLAATLNGTANPEGFSTTVHFEWGTSTGYGNSTPPMAAGSGSSAVAATATITGLIAGTQYHFRTVATNANGTTLGPDVAFYPYAPPAPAPATAAASSLNGSPFTYQLYDLATGRYLGRLPLSGVTFGSQILSPGTATGTIDIASTAVQNLAPLSITTPGRTMLAIDYLGALIWAGVIWPRGYKFDNVSRQLTITASELWSYFQQRVQATDYSSPPYSGITGIASKMAIWNATNTDAIGVYDPVLVAWQILSDALTQVQYGNLLGGLGLAANGFTTASGYLASGTATPAANYIAVNYPYSSLQQIHNIVNTLASNGIGTGFDYAVDIAYSSGPGSAPVGTVNLSYPRRGRSYAQNNLVLNCGSAISYDAPEDGAQIGNTIYETGSSGSLVISQNVNPLQGGYPLLEQIKSRSSVTSANVINVLTALGLSDLAQLSYPVATPSVTMDLFASSVPLGNFIVGDNARWIVPATDGAGNVFDPRFPSGYDNEWRINGYSATVKDEGQSTIRFDLAQPPVLVPTANPLP